MALSCRARRVPESFPASFSSACAPVLPIPLFFNFCNVTSMKTTHSRNGFFNKTK